MVRSSLPLMANMVEGGKTPIINASGLQELGFSFVIFPGGIVRAIAADRDEIVRPLTMKMILILTRFMPRASAWLNAKTGWQRPPQLP